MKFGMCFALEHLSCGGGYGGKWYGCLIALHCVTSTAPSCKSTATTNKPPQPSPPSPPKLHVQDDGYTNYTSGSYRAGKRACKMALQKELGLPVNPDIPLLGFIGRLDYQKGVDLIR